MENVTQFHLCITDRKHKDIVVRAGIYPRRRPQNHSLVIPPDQNSDEILEDSCCSNSETQFSFENQVLVFFFFFPVQTLKSSLSTCDVTI